MSQPIAFRSFRRRGFLLCTNCLSSAINGWKFLQYYTKQCLLLKFRLVMLWIVSARNVYVLHFHTNSRLDFHVDFRYTSRTQTNNQKYHKTKSFVDPCVELLHLPTVRFSVSCRPNKFTLGYSLSVSLITRSRYFICWMSRNVASRVESPNICFNSATAFSCTHN